MGFGSVAPAVAAKKRALVYVEERHIARLLQVNLERKEFDVSCVDNCTDAVNYLGQCPHDLIIFDRDVSDAGVQYVRDWIADHEAPPQILVLDRREPRRPMFS